MSYQGYGQQDSKELQPSLIVEELFSYLDKYYTIQGKKVSENCIFKHPFDAFDERYFIKDRGLHNFSQHDFQAAQTHYKTQKAPPHRFLNDFTCIEHPKPSIIEHNSQIDLKHLSAVARNPIKFHLNKVLEIYIQTEEDRKLKTEEESLFHALDKYQMKHYALKEPIETVLYKAEREGKLPFGLFKTVATKRLKEEVEEIHERLLKHSIDPAHMFQIEFCTSCSQPTQLEEDRWLFPAVSLHMKMAINFQLWANFLMSRQRDCCFEQRDFSRCLESMAAISSLLPCSQAMPGKIRTSTHFSSFCSTQKSFF